jgi:hypothetical protein
MQALTWATISCKSVKLWIIWNAGRRDSLIEKTVLVGLCKVQAMNSRLSGHIFYAFTFVQKLTVSCKREFCQCANSNSSYL